MSSDITGLCSEHSFEPAIDICRLCGHEFCGVCLVRPSGKSLCKSCAMAAAGVRSTGTHRPLSKRDIKRRLKAFESIRANRRVPQEIAPLLTDPLTEPEAQAPPADLESAGSADPVPHEPVDPDLVAQAAAQLAGHQAGPEESEPANSNPGGDIAPPIDWSRPFG